MKVIFTIVAIIIIGVVGFNALSNAIDAQNAAKAAQEQADMLKSQEILNSLPDWGKTLILTIGAIYAMETFGPKLLLVSAMTVLVVLVIVVMVLFQLITAFSRPRFKEAYQYAFYNSVIVSGLVVIAGGFMLANIPGGAELFRKLFTGTLIFGFFALGGGFAFKGNLGKFKSVTDEHGNTTTELEPAKVALSVTGRGRKGSDTNVTFD